MYTPTLSEILEEAGSFRHKEQKVEFLKKHNSIALKNVLALTYDKNKTFLVPDTEPPYNPSVEEDNQGMIHGQMRKLKYIIEGFSPPNISQTKRETIFIQMLETVHRDDAKVLIQMVQKKPFKGISKPIVNEVFGLNIK